MADATETASYEPPRIERRTDIGPALIGFLNGSGNTDQTSG